MSDQHPTWPATLSVPDAARLLGVGRTAAYELVRTGQWPTPVVRLGCRVVVPTRPLLALLGITDPAAAGLIDPVEVRHGARARHGGAR